MSYPGPNAGLEKALARAAIERLKTAQFRRSASPTPGGDSRGNPEVDWRRIEAAATTAALAIALSDNADPSVAEIALLAKNVQPVANWSLHGSCLEDCAAAVALLTEALDIHNHRLLASLRASADWASNSPSAVFQAATLLSELGERDEAERVLLNAPKEHTAQPMLVAAKITTARNGGDLSQAFEFALSGVRRWPRDVILRNHLRRLCIQLHRLTDLEWPNLTAKPAENARDAFEVVQDLLRQNKTSAALESLWDRRELLLSSAAQFLSVVSLLASEFGLSEPDRHELAQLMAAQPVQLSLGLQRLLSAGIPKPETFLEIARRATTEASDDLPFWEKLCRTTFMAADLMPPKVVHSRESVDWILARCSAAPVDHIYMNVGASAGYNVPGLDLQALHLRARVRRRWDHGRLLNYNDAKECFTPRSRDWFAKLRRSGYGAFIFTVHARQEAGLQKQLLPVAACAYGLKTTGVKRWATITDHPGEKYLEQLPLAPEYISRRSTSAIDLAARLNGLVRAGGIVHLPMDFVDGWHSQDAIVVPGYLKPFEVAEFNGRVALMSGGSVAFGASYVSADAKFVVDVADVALPPDTCTIGTRSRWLLQRVARVIRKSYIEEQIPLDCFQIASGGGVPLARPLIATEELARVCPDVQASLFGRVLLDDKFPGGSPAICGESSEGTFADVRRRSLACAQMILHFQELKSAHVNGRRFRDQHRVLAVLPPGEALAEIGLGALAAGSLLCICHTDVGVETLERRIGDFNPDLTIITSSAADELARTNRELRGPVLVCDDKGDGETIEDLIVGFQPAPRLPPYEPDRPGLVVFTSGSTAMPKGVVLRQGLHSVGYDHTEKVVEDSRYVVVSRWDTVSFAGVLTTLRRGSAVHLVSRAISTSPSHLANYLVRRRITALSAPSTIWHSLAEHDDFAAATIPLFRGGVAWGERFASSAVKKIAAKFPAIWLSLTYGATEASHVSARVLIDHGKIANEGELMPIQPRDGTTLRLVNEAGDQVSMPQQSGRLEITGPNVMLGYFHDLYSKNEPVAHGIVRSILVEDLAALNAEGIPVLLGRAGTVLKIAGRRVSLTEIEFAAERIPRVRRAVAMSHEGELTPEIWLALEGDPEMSPSSIAARVAELTTPEARPRRIKIFDRFPVLDSGKIDLIDLRDTFDDAGENNKATPSNGPPDDQPEALNVHILSEIAAWLKRHDCIDQDEDDVAEIPLADSYIDSLLQLELLMFLERTFGASIDHRYLPIDSDLTFAALASAVARTIRNRRPTDPASTRA